MSTATVMALADDVTISLSQTPAVIQKTIQSQEGDGTLGDISKSTIDEETVYDVGLTAKDGTDRDFSVAEDGTLLTVEVPLAETPVAAQSAIQTELNGGALDSIDKNLADTEISYDVSGTAKDGKDRNFTVADDGALLSLEVTLAATPDVVQKTIAAQLGNGKVQSISENFDEDGTNFDVEATGPHKSFNVSADGTLTSERVVLARVPPKIKETIMNRIGDGTVLRVDKSLVRTMGVFPFQVEGRKDGKSFNFSVGPRGRFLGMDQ